MTKFASTSFQLWLFSNLHTLTLSQWMSVRNRILLCGEPGLGGDGGLTGGLGIFGKVMFHDA